MSKLWNHEHETVCDVLCCVMVSDGTASASEKAHVARLMNKFADWDAEHSKTHISQFSGRVRAEGLSDVLKQACAALGKTDENTLKELEAMCLEVADVDTDIHDREARIIRRIRSLRDQLEQQMLLYEVEWDRRRSFYLSRVIGLAVAGGVCLTLALLPRNQAIQIMLGVFGLISLGTAWIIHQKHGGQCPSCGVKYFWSCTDSQYNVRRNGRNYDAFTYTCEVCGHAVTEWKENHGD